ncbi:MAG: hypothetical protein KAV82_02815, partial [Phycisphaerae bacterium]|nr:hypothetical protein [Phycisphaerae bacterium]
MKLAKIAIMVMCVSTSLCQASTRSDCNSNGIPDEYEAGSVLEEAKLVAADAAAGDTFGFSVSASEQVALVGARASDRAGLDSGAAYVFRRSGVLWEQEACLTASDATDQALFGAAVAIDGVDAVIGAPKASVAGKQRGAAYVFQFTDSQWQQQTKLTASDAAIEDMFGLSVSIDGDVVVVGAPGKHDGVGCYCGAAYVFRHNGMVWEQEAKLSAADHAAGDFFGVSVAVSADLIIVGAYLHDDGTVWDTGAAYVFRHNGSGWEQEAKLTAADHAAGDYFGFSVAASGQVVLVGAWGDDDDGTDSGSAYMFRYNDTVWEQVAKLTAADASSGDGFGNSVSMYGHLVLVGAPGDADSGDFSGSSYIFSHDNLIWLQQAKVTASDAAGGDFFGHAGAITGSTIITAAPYDGDAGADSGSVYAFAFRTDCNSNGVLDECDIAAGTSTDCNGNNLPDECDLDIGQSADCNTNAIPDECDISAATSRDCNFNGIPDECEPDDDCNENGLQDFCDIYAGTSTDCNTNAIPDECDIAGATSHDCNTNSLPDECDILAGTSADCNNNDMPDECESQADCNANGIQDICDIYAGTSADCNTNAVPDECDIAGATSDDYNGNDVPDDCEPADLTPPETIITLGPADGTVLGVTDVTFEWTGTDNFALVEHLTFSSCFWSGCDPSSGPFSDETSHMFHSLDEGTVTIKITTRDPAGNIDPTPEVRSFTIDLTPPEIVGHVPTGDVYVPVDYVDLTFDEEINGDTFTVSDVDLVGPDGPIGVNWPVYLGDNVWRIGFVSQDTEGQYTITVGPNITDAVGNGMEASYTGDFTIMLPDLMVNSITIPADALTEQEIEVSWATTNGGDGSATGSWQDCVYLSDDDAIGGDTLLGCFVRPVELESGGSYDTAAMVTIPELLPEGDYWIIVITDGQEELVELVEGVENNGLVSAAPIALTLFPRPDLQITGLTPPPDIPSGAWVEVTWTVTNMGNAPAIGPWNERISGSTDDIIGDDNAGSNEYRYAGVLAPGESIVRVEIYQAPGTIPPGGFWIVVCADTGDEVPEQAEDNNCAIAEVCIDCLQPDLVVSSIVAPAEATGFINVNWTVLNDGNGTAHGYWRDRVYLSADSEVGGDDILVGEFQQIGPLDVAESYTDGGPVSIPVELEGAYYLVVTTDALNNVPEPGGENNNSLVSSNGVNISQPDLPDLVVSQLTAPTEVVTGETITVTWTVSNAGELAADGAWIDRVYLSDDDQYDAGDTTMALFAPPGLLGAGETYPGSVEFAMPETPGDYWVIVYTDVNDNIEEGADDDNNTRVSSIVVSPAPRPDLLMVEVIAEATGVAGSEVTVQWTVRNDGEAEATGMWTDRVYISTDAVVGDDLQLGQFYQSDPLEVSNEYTRQEYVTVPITFEGHYYFLVVTDAYDELDEGPDTAANQRFTGQTTEIVQPDLPDLTVTMLTAPATGFTSENIEVSWEVSNIGEWTAVGHWKDRLYLSTNNQWDASDLLLGWVDIDVPLVDGTSYVAGGDYRLPPQAGTYWLIVITNADGDVEEGTALANNTYVSPSTITVEHPPCPDLQVLSVEPPATQVAGEPVEVTWTVANTSSSIPASGPWYERIYVSPNAQIGGDSLVANVFYDETLQPGESVVRTYELSTPYMPDGYYLVVCVDGGSHVDETNENNNCAITATASHIVLPDLAVSDVVAPAEAYAGSVIPISWTVTNIGGASTEPFHWVDAVYMSHDGQSTLLGTRYYMMPLLPTSSYTGEVNVTLPDRIAGEYQFYVVSDVYDYVHEDGPAENNTADAPNPTNIVQPDRPNLVVTDIVLSSNGVTWTVTNTGAASAEGFWCDRVVAVSESIGQEFFVLGDYYRSTPVAAGDSYSWTEPIELELDDPALHGEYRIVVTTDYTDTLNEGLDGGEYDNTTTDDETFTVTAPDRPNLVV